MAGYFAIPKEVQTLIVKINITPDRPVQIEDLIPGLNLLPVEEWVRHFTCHYLYRIDDNNYHEISEFDVTTRARTLIGRVRHRPLGPKLAIQAFCNPGIDRKFPEDYRDLKQLEWDLTERNDKSKCDTTFFVDRAITWNELKSDPMRVLTRYQAKADRVGDFNDLLADCRSLKPGIAHIILKFSLECASIQCVTHPGEGHGFRANYVLNLVDQESLQMSGTPRWRDLSLGQPACQCEAEFRSIDTTKIYTQNPPAST